MDPNSSKQEQVTVDPVLQPSWASPAAPTIGLGMMSTSNLPKLDGKNYQSWIELINIVLQLRGLQSAITSSCADMMVDLQARLIILETMDESHRAQVRGCATAKSIIDRLQLVYADKSAANVYRMLHQYYRYVKKPDDSISEHIGKMDEMRNQLADLGEKQSEAVYQVTLIGSLPAEYAQIMELWELTHPDMRTTPNLVSRLLKREEDLKKKGEDSAFLARGGTAKPKMTRKEIEDLKKVTSCGVCRKVGHWAKECPDNPDRQPNLQERHASGRGPQVNSKGGTAMIAEIEDEVVFQASISTTAHLEDQWVSDSGASKHMSNHEDWFESLEPPGDSRYVKVGDGKRLPIKGVGSIKIESLVDGQWKPSTLSNVQFVPGLSANLISVGAADSNGISTLFSGNECTMMQQGKVVATGAKLDDKLYLMRIRVRPTKLDKAYQATLEGTMSEYHRLLGHVSADRVKTLLADLNIKCPANDAIDCEVCPGGKGKHVSHPLRNEEVVEPGHLHVDLSGIINKPSLQGFRYYLLCKDQYTDFVLVYLCKAKSEVPLLLAKLLIDFETLANTPVRTIHSDNGSEFVNKMTEILFLKNKVKHVTSAPFCPQQNGRIEREMQSVNNMARTMLLASKLPTELWPEAVGTAVYLKNRLPNSKSKVTPFERLLKMKPYISHLVEFGRPCHIIKNDEYLVKWDCRTYEGFVVGFTPRRNTYKVFVPSKNRVISTPDVILAKHSRDTASNIITRGDSTNKTEVQIQVPSRDQSPGQSNYVYQQDETQWESDSSQAEQDEQQAPAPKNRLCTGARLDEFFNTYYNQEPDYAEVSGDQSSILEAPPVLPPRDYQVRHSPERPNVPPPPPPIYENAGASQPNARPSLAQELAHAEGQIQSGGAGRVAQQSETCPKCQQEGEWAAYVLDYDLSLEDEWVAFVDCDKAAHMIDIPKTFAEAMRSDESKNWREAIATELEALQVNQTWIIVEIPRDERILSAKWVFAIKRDASGNIVRFKARLVARGFEQIKGKDYTHTFAPVARIDSIRTLLAICGAKGYCLLQFDISSAFLNGKIDEDVYVQPPDGLDVPSGMCLKLDKALYGLKQAPRAWNNTFNSALLELGFSQSWSDPCVYWHKQKLIYVVIYVDDGLVMGPNRDECQAIISKLGEKFSLKQLAGDCFLGMSIVRGQEQGLAIHQKRYIQDILTRFNMDRANGATSPINDVYGLINDDGEFTQAPYREALGCLQYLACCTRPDIMFAVSVLSRFSKAPRAAHWTALKRVLKYLKHTQDYRISYQVSDKLEPQVYSDADWAGDAESRQSTSGIIIILGGGPIVYASRKQPDIAQSSTEAEYISANDAAKETKWLVQFLTELKVDHSQPVLAVDNHSTIHQIENNDTKRRAKHVDIRYHFIRQQLRRGLFKVRSVESSRQLADFLTKPLGGQKLAQLLDEAGCASN